MTTTKLFFMAALALMMTASCCSDDNEPTIPQPAKAEGIPFTATITVDKGATTRALEESGGNIEATWATGEQVALIYSVSGTPYKTDATVTAQGDGTATISATLQEGATNGSAVTIIYPATAADGTTGNVKADLLTAQNGLLTGEGSIAEKYDVRTGSGVLTVNGTATVNNGTPGTPVALTNQNSIFKFTLTGCNLDSSHPLIIKDSEGKVITTVTPSSSTSNVYVAMPPAASSRYYFMVNDDSNNAYFKTGTATIAVGKYYQTTLSMSLRYPIAANSADVSPADIGCMLAANGNIYKNAAAANSASTAQAVIAYVGSAANYFNKFLALALTDVDNSTHTWADALTKVGNHPITIGSTIYNTSTTGSTYYDRVADNQGTSSATRTTAAQTGWRLPSVTDWRYVIDGLGRIKGGLAISDGTNALLPTSPLGVSDGMEYRNGSNGSSLRAAINTACGNDALLSNYYWSSSEYTDNSGNAWRCTFYNGQFWHASKESGDHVRAVFAY